jgi:hypothetical protein
MQPTTPSVSASCSLDETPGGIESLRRRLYERLTHDFAIWDDIDALPWAGPHVGRAWFRGDQPAAAAHDPSRSM